jgi:DNA-binding CsgD family transcriptional regulator
MQATGSVDEASGSCDEEPTQADLDRCIGALYRAAAGLTDWPAALDAMARPLDAWNVHLMGIDTLRGVLLFSHEGGNPPPQGTLDYVREWHRRDPRSALVLSNAPGRWFHDHEHFDEKFVSADPFYRDFLLPYGMRFCSGMRFEPEPCVTYVFSASRAVGRRPFNDREREWLRRLGYHLQTAIEVRTRTFKATSIAFAGYTLLQRLAYPIFVVDEQRCVLFHNEAAASLLRGGGLVLKEGRLRLGERSEDSSFTSAMKAVLLEDGSRDRTSAFVKVIKSLGEARSLVHISRATPPETMGAFGHFPILLVTFFGIDAPSALDPFAVGVAFDLTPAEARVAVGIAAGETISSIADRLSVRVATVRTHLKAVFGKVGVKRQAELAQLLSGSPVFWKEFPVSADR